MSANGKNAPENHGGADPDDAPELDDAFFERAEIRDGGVLIKEGEPPIGRPAVESPKPKTERKVRPSGLRRQQKA